MTKLPGGPDFDRYLVELYEAMTMQEIADFVGVSRQRVHQRIKRTGTWRPRTVTCPTCGEKYQYGQGGEHRADHPAPGRRGRPQTLEESLIEEGVVEDYLAGMPIDDIARKYRTTTGLPMTYVMVYRRLHRAGVELNRGGGRYIRTPEVQRKRLETVARKKAGIPVPKRGWRPDDV